MSKKTNRKQPLVIGITRSGNMKIDEIYKLKRLAGIIDKEGTKVHGDDESNVSITASDKGKYQREKNIRPGTDEWFKLWFSKPYMTGEKPMPKGKDK